MRVVAEVDYVLGNTKFGHYEVNIPNMSVQTWENLSINEQMEMIKDGKFIIDDYYINKIGNIVDIEVIE